MLPIFLDMTDRLAVVVGGGDVGRRKLGTLLESGARVRLVCLEPRAADLTSPCLEWLTEAYRPEHLAGAALVFAAATPIVNRQVVADARALWIWVNAADEPQGGDFFLPAFFRRGAFMVAVSTGGAAPHLARSVRDRLATQFDAAFDDWLRLLGELRPFILAHVPAAERRRQLFVRLCEWSWLDRLRHDGVDAARKAMWAEVLALADAPREPL
jgi:precorrin-2 dehydrogenase/sirohydrochlorin ferrochelatase